MFAGIVALLCLSFILLSVVLNFRKIQNEKKKQIKDEYNKTEKEKQSKELLQKLQPTIDNINREGGLSTFTDADILSLRDNIDYEAFCYVSQEFEKTLSPIKQQLGSGKLDIRTEQLLSYIFRTGLKVGSDLTIKRLNQQDDEIQSW